MYSFGQLLLIKEDQDPIFPFTKGFHAIGVQRYTVLDYFYSFFIIIASDSFSLPASPSLHWFPSSRQPHNCKMFATAPAIISMLHTARRRQEEGSRPTFNFGQPLLKIFPGIPTQQLLFNLTGYPISYRRLQT